MKVQVIGAERLNKTLEFYAEVYNMTAVEVKSKFTLIDGKVERLYTIYF